MQNTIDLYSQLQSFLWYFDRSSADKYMFP